MTIVITIVTKIITIVTIVITITVTFIFYYIYVLLLYIYICTVIVYLYCIYICIIVSVLLLCIVIIIYCYYYLLLLLFIVIIMYCYYYLLLLLFIVIIIYCYYYAPQRRNHIVAALSAQLSVLYLVRQIILKLLLAFKSNLVYRYIAMRGRAELKNRNPTLYIYSVISPWPFFIIVACPGRILKRDWNETRYIDRWQWEEVPCTRTIILPCIFT